MKKYLSLLLIFGFVSVITSAARAQSSNTDKSSTNSSSSNNRFFKAFGYCPFLGLSVSPERTYSGFNTYNGETTVQANFFMYDFYDFVFGFRYNLTEFNNNSSLSVGTYPDIGLSYGGGLIGTYQQNAIGVLSVNIPVFIEYNAGNVSTYTADKDKGFIIGVGFEFTDAPIIPIGEGTYTDGNGVVHNVMVPTAWVEPAAEIGYRYWNKNNKAKEFNLKVGVGASDSFTVRLSWIKYIGY